MEALCLNVMHLTIAYFKIKKRNLVLINNDIQRETLSERPIRQPLTSRSKQSYLHPTQVPEEGKFDI